MACRLAVDIGGTFTDVVLQTATGRRVTTKQLTTHQDPAQGVVAGVQAALAEAAHRPEQVELIIHGTTLATNALIERRGAATALLTTAGHRDTLAMAHEDRFEQYDINIDRPEPLVPRYLRLPIRERLNHRGEVLLPLVEDDVAAVLPVLDAAAIESVAIGYLHAFMNPAHEQRTAELLQRARPDLSLSLASEVCPEIREYERLSTACANAYVRPLMAGYLQRLESELRKLGMQCGFLLMTSGGGLTTLDTAARFPIRLVESGPAGGAILARAVARQCGLPSLLSFDMGGTTAKLCLLDDYRALHSRSFEVDRVYRFKKGSGLPVRIPVIEMVEIGAGGGSLARVDHLGRLQVGPHSAGSEPGPAAYGRGGEGAAVTDADLCMGKLQASDFAGGALQLNTQAAAQAVHKHIAEPLQLSGDAAAAGISEVVGENMASAARAHGAEFGLSLASRAMVAFGGAAPLHATRLGEKLGVQRIVIPTEAGVGSAVGFLLAPIAFEVVRSRHQLLHTLEPTTLNALMDEMRLEAQKVVDAAGAGAELTETRQAYMRYLGQGHEIAVVLPNTHYGQADRVEFQRRFEQAYTQLYGSVIEGVEIEALSWTLTLSGPEPELPTARRVKEDVVPAAASAQQTLLNPVSLAREQAKVYARAALRPGQTINGPALITETQTTTVLGPDWQAELDPHGHLLLQRREPEGA